MDDTRDTASGRTSPALSPPTEETISELSSKQLSELKKKGSRCLRLKITDGQNRTYFWETDGAWLTEFSMLNTGVSPNAAQESTLSQILLVEVPEKYYLLLRQLNNWLFFLKIRQKNAVASFPDF